jgi:hypothetical protein
MKWIFTFVLCIILLCSLLAQNKKIIQKASELPNRYYAVQFVDANNFFKLPKYFDDLAKRLSDSLLLDLAQYDIKETQTVSDYYYKLAYLSFGMKEDKAKTLDYIKRARQFAQKKTEKILRGYDLEVMIHTLVENPSDTLAFGQSFKKNLFNLLPANPNEEERKAIDMSTSSWKETTNEKMLKLLKYKKFDGKINENDALDISILYVISTIMLPYQSAIVSAHENWLNSVKLKKNTNNIWLDRTIELSYNECKSPVVVAIWDTGVDMETVPYHKRWQNPNEQLDGLDNDKNNCVDDIHGISINLDGSADNTYTYLVPLDSSKLKSIDSLLQKKDLKEDKIKAQEERKKLAEQVLNVQKIKNYSHYVHGTHVAGIVVDGNPAVKIMSVRTGDLTYKDTTLKPKLNVKHSDVFKTITFHNLKDKNARLARNTIMLGQYIKQNKAKIVNMSWSMQSKKELSKYLSDMGNIAKIDETENVVFIEEVYNNIRSSVYKVISESPEILFIAAAGNSNTDPSFQEAFPSGFEIPNLLVVGAVDKKGSPTSFTCIGSSIHVYADGFEVESYVPGGGCEKMSGTSMASPQVANLAAKILAINPNLTPTELKDLIIKNSDKSPDGLLLINPKKTIEALRKQ